MKWSSKEHKLINTLLEKLLKACNKSNILIERQKFNITHKRYDFYHSLTINERLKCHEQLELIGRQTGALQLKYAVKAFGDEDLLESVNLTDVRRLCHFLNIQIFSENTQLAFDAIEEIKNSCPSWLSDTLTEIQDGWCKGKKPFNCCPDDKSKILDACRFIVWAESISPSQLVAADIRTVSAQLFNDSKKLENLASKVKSLMKNKLPEEVMALSATEVLSYIGVSRFPPLFRFKGNLVIEFKSGEIETVHCWPYIGVSPDGVSDIVINQPPKYVLFIENQTTFERYCREVADNGLVFYTNGFPSRAWQSLYSKVESLLPPETPMYHWGDIDIGGYQILAHMASLFERSVIPYMMTPNEQTRVSEKTIDVDKLIKCLDKVDGGPICKLKNTLKSLGKSEINWVEQESLEVKPVC